MYSWCTAICGQVTCRRLVSTSSGNQSRTSSAHCDCGNGASPGAIPAATAGAMYLRIVLRSSPNEADTSLIDRPACQWTSISVTSITVKLLLAIGSLVRRRDEGE